MHPIFQFIYLAYAPQILLYCKRPPDSSGQRGRHMKENSGSVVILDLRERFANLPCSLPPVGGSNAKPWLWAPSEESSCLWQDSITSSVFALNLKLFWNSFGSGHIVRKPLFCGSAQELDSIARTVFGMNLGLWVTPFCQAWSHFGHLWAPLGITWAPLMTHG
jgi:hypothetical protein